MDTLTLALAAGLGWTSGIRLYATVFFLGLLQFGSLHYGAQSALPPSLAVLAHPWVIGISGLLFITEFLADKVPGFDSLWDALHTFIRIPGGALLAAAAVIDADPGLALAAGLLGGTLAASAHLTKAGSRALINLSPEPVSNWLASLSEDVLTLGVLWTMLKFPLLLLILVGILVLACALLLPRLWRGIRRVLAWRRA